MLSNKGGGEVAGNEIGILQQALQERNVGGDATDAELSQSAPGAAGCEFKVAATAGELHQHGVEVARDLSAG